VLGCGLLGARPPSWGTEAAGGDESAVPASPSLRWGYAGHEMAARAAVGILPEAMPAFFRDATDHLAYLAPEPDRWRVRSRPAMDQAWSYDHYIDFENVPSGALDAADRFTFLRRLYAAGVERPEAEVGFLPYRIVELYERLVTEWRLWHEAPPRSDRRRWVEHRILNDAGLLAHYVTDGSQPHHTTIHFDGWARGTPNPERFTTDRGFHSRFERYFVEAHVEEADLRRRMPVAPRDLQGPIRDTVVQYLRTTFATVPELYRIDRDAGFDPRGPASEQARDFAVDRLAAGSEMLAALWQAAWLEGGG